MVTIQTPIQSWSEKENLLAHLPQISNGQSGIDESKNSSEIYQESQSTLHIAIPFILATCRQALYVFWQDGHHMVYFQEHLLKVNKKKTIWTFALHFPHTVVSKMFLWFIWIFSSGYLWSSHFGRRFVNVLVQPTFHASI